MIHLILSVFISLTLSKDLPHFDDIDEIEDSSGTLKEHILKKVVLAHQEVKLECQKANMPNITNDVQYSWVFHPSTEDAQYSQHVVLCGTTGQAPCTNKLILENVNKTQTGLYKCNLVKQRPGYVATSTPIITVHLEVTDQEVKPPKFVEGPGTVNVYESTPAFLSCHVETEIPLEIKWFKKDNYSKRGMNVIHYNNNTYRPLNNSITTRNKTIVTSVLSFDKVYKNDSGIYACSFISPNGKIIYEEGHISVHQTLVVFSSLVQEKWEMFAAAMIVVILVIVTLSCMIILCCKKVVQKVEDPPLNLMGKPDDGNDTSDYEHVIL